MHKQTYPHNSTVGHTPTQKTKEFTFRPKIHPNRKSILQTSLPCCLTSLDLSLPFQHKREETQCVQKQSSYLLVLQDQLNVWCLSDKNCSFQLCLDSPAYFGCRDKTYIDGKPVAEETILDDLDDESCSLPFCHVGAEPVSICKKIHHKK